MMPKEPMRGATLFSHANKMTKAYHIMLTPLCKETGLPPLAMDILLFLANNPEHNTAKDICRMRGHKPGIVSVHVERLVNDGLLERREMPGDRRRRGLSAPNRRKRSLSADGRCSGSSEDVCSRASRRRIWRRCAAALKEWMAI